MTWLSFFKAAENGDILGTFDGLAALGTLPMAVGPDAKGKLKNPDVNGYGWGRLSIEERRKKLVDRLRTHPGQVGLGVQPIGHIVIDIDPPNKNRDLLDECQVELDAALFANNMPATLTIGTQAGRHLWFKASPKLVAWWGDSGKKKIKLSNGAAAELFLGIATKQTQVVMPPTDGKMIEVEMEPVELPDDVVDSIIRMIEPERTSTIPPAVVNVPRNSYEETWFQQRAQKIVSTIANAQENNRHDTFRGGMVAMAGYAAGVGCLHLRDWFLDSAKAAHKYAKPEVSEAVLRLTAEWAWARGTSWPMLPDWILKKRSGQDYDPNTTTTEDEPIEEIEQVEPEPLDVPDLTTFDNPHRLAREWIDQQGIRRVVYWQGEFWQWQLGCYDLIPIGEIDSRLSMWLDGMFATHAAQEYMRIEDPKMRAGIKVKPVTPKVVESVRKAIAAITTREIADIEAMPAWLCPHEWDAREVVCMKNAILNPRRMEVANLTSDFFTRYQAGYEWNANAPEPKRWLAFLRSIWPDDDDCIRELQKWFGLILTQDTRYQKILLMIGPPRSGKGTIARILAAMIGIGNVASPSLGDLAQPFGLAKCVGRPLAIIPDARIGNRLDQSMIVERLLSISGEDRVSIDRKYKEAFEGRLPTRIVICSNELPQLHDTTGALPSRYLILPMTKSHLGIEDKTLESELLAELPGIICWAIAGFRMLIDDGGFLQTESGKRRLLILQELCSPIAAFMNEWFVVSGKEEDKVECDALYAKWKSWCEETGHHAGSVHKFYKNLTDAYPVCGKKRTKKHGILMYCYTGIIERFQKNMEPVEKHGTGLNPSSSIF
jgi:putative DNA primase/helicase